MDSIQSDLGMTPDKVHTVTTFNKLPRAFKELKTSLRAYLTYNHIYRVLEIRRIKKLKLKLYLALKEGNEEKIVDKEFYYDKTRDIKLDIGIH